MQSSEKRTARGARWVRLSLLLVPLTMVCGCRNMSHTERGALGGAALGGVGGALVGNALGNTGAGAAVGAALGGIAGGVSGQQTDELENRTIAAEHRASQAEAAAYQATQPGPLSLDDVIRLSQRGLSDSLIISQIRATGMRYHRLSSNDIIYLHENGVSQRVIQEMQSTMGSPLSRGQAPEPRTVVVREPVVVRETVAVPVYPCSRPRVGIHFSSRGRCR